MKKFGKILSSVLASTMVVSCFAMNVFAASTARTITITPSKTEALAAGETISVEVAIDNTKKLVNVDYTLSFDPTVFEVDKNQGWMSMEDFLMHENYVDQTWYDGMKAKPFGKLLSSTVVNTPTDGSIFFSYAGANGVPDAVNATDFVIGKFNLKVKADAANGSYAISLAGKTMDSGENSTADAICAPVTVKVGEDAPVVPPVTYDDVKTGAFTFFGGSKYNGNEGFKLFFNKTENEVTTEVYAELAKAAIFGENTEVEKDMEVSVGVQVEDVPSNVVLEFLRAEWLETLSK